MRNNTTWIHQRVEHSHECVRRHDGQDILVARAPCIYTARYRFFVEHDLQYTSVEVLAISVECFIVRREMV